MKMIKKTTAALAVLATLTASASAFAAVEANFGVTSNYLWRGVSQSSNDPSVSGGVDYSNDSGFYLGTWVGSIDWGTGGGVEHDYYLGYGGESGDFGYDVGYIYYNYPTVGYEDSDFGELYFNGTYDAFGFGLAYTINSEVDDGYFTDGDLYYYVSYGFDLPEEYSVGVTLGAYDFDFGGEGDYEHIQIDLAKGDFTFSISKAAKSSVASNDTNFVISWGTTF